MSSLEPLKENKPSLEIGQQIASVINDVDPRKVSKIVEAIVEPFQKPARQTRREILLFTGIFILTIIGVLSWLTFTKVIDSSYLVFFFATVFGYIMGFITRYFAHD